MPPILSIVMPAYNAEQYVERAVSSILHQTLVNLELIVVDDGSSDSTNQILEEIVRMDSRLTVCRKENGGVSSARNIGLARAKGKYLLYVDADDWIDPDCCQQLIKAAEDLELDVVVFDFSVDLPSGVVNRYYDLKGFGGKVMNGAEYLSLLFTGQSYPSLCNKLFRRNLHLRVQNPEGIGLGEDFATTCQLVSIAGRIGKIDSPFYHYYQNGDGATQNGLALKIHQLAEVFRIIELEVLARPELSHLLEKFRSYRLAHVQNLIFLEPAIGDDRYEKGLQLLQNVLSDAGEVPSWLPLHRRLVLATLIRIPRMAFPIIWTANLVRLVLGRRRRQMKKYAGVLST